jgi:hypothetical protein
VQRAAQVDRQRVLEVVGGHVLDRADLDHARVVDQDVDRAEVVLDARHEPQHVVAVGDVALGAEHLAAELLELLARPPQLVGIARADRDPGAVLDQRAREHQAEPA